MRSQAGNEAPSMRRAGKSLGMSFADGTGRGAGALARLAVWIVAVAVVVVVAAAAALMAQAADRVAPLRLGLALDRGVLPADGTQKAYVRVELEGVPREEVRMERRPVNMALVIDHSGSMSGQKIQKAREAAILAVDRLRADDILSVVVYDSNVQVLVPATKVGDGEMFRRAIRTIQAGSSTALFAGVSKGAAEMRKFLARDRVNRLVLLSDGLANVGPQSPGELGDLGASLLEDGISVTTIGLGLDYNEDLMTRLAVKSDGSHYFAEEAGDLAKVFEKELGRALSVVAQEIVIEIRCAAGVRPVRILGREGEVRDGVATVRVNHLYGNEAKAIILEVDVPAARDGESRPVASAHVRYADLSDNGRMADAQAEVAARFAKSQAEVDNSLNRDVKVDVVELVATENNIRAMRLRDEGKVEEAKAALGANRYYLGTNNSTLNSPRLNVYYEQQAIDAVSMDGRDWGEQRKKMQQTQTGNINRNNDAAEPSKTGAK